MSFISFSTIFWGHITTLYSLSIAFSIESTTCLFLGWLSYITTTCLKFDSIILFIDVPAIAIELFKNKLSIGPSTTYTVESLSIDSRPYMSGLLSIILTVIYLSVSPLIPLQVRPVKFLSKS